MRFRKDKPKLDKPRLPSNGIGQKGRVATQTIVRIAFMSALLTALKLALAFIPNVEVVTLLILVYGACFPFWQALAAVVIFCVVEVALYGMGSWVLLYFVYWPLLALFANLFLKKQNVWVAILVALVGSVLFGVLSACCDTLICMANLTSQQLAPYFVAYYLRGLGFDAVHCVSNVIVVGLLFLPLTKVCNAARARH